MRVVRKVLGFRSAGPVQKTNVPSSQTPTIVVTCGRPSGRTVDSQLSLSLLQVDACLRPRCGRRTLATEPRVQLGSRAPGFAFLRPSFRRLHQMKWLFPLARVVAF